MTREEFLNELKNALTALPEEELEGVLTYYGEMIDDRMEAGMSEEAAVKAMEPVKVIAARVLEEAGVAPDKKTEKAGGNWKEIRFAPEKVRLLHIQAQDKRVRIHGEEDQTDVVLRYCIGANDIFSLREEDGAVTLEHKLRPMSSFVYEKSDGTVTLDSILEGVGKFFSSLGDRVFSSGGIFCGDPAEREIEVLLPETFDGGLEVHTSNAQITLDDVTIPAAAVRLATSNARVTASDVKCGGKVTLATSNSRIVLDDVNADSLQLTTSNGRIVLDDVLTRGDLTATTSNGSVSAEDTIVGGAAHLTTSNGKVEVENLECGDITIKSSNGAVSGSVKGLAADYTVTSATSNGQNQLGNRAGGEKKLNVRTSNASITLGFTE